MTGLIIELAILLPVLGILIWVLYSTVIGGSLGAPFVRTPSDLADKVLREMNIMPGDKFWDLGCGDGSIVKSAMNNYKAKGYGVEINPILAVICRAKGIDIKGTNILKTDFGLVDKVYMYLGPGVVEKVAQKIEKSENKLIILASRRFEIYRWKKWLTKRISDGTNWVYLYNYKKS